MKNKRKLGEINCVTTRSGCVKWDGPDIACLDICAGDELNDVIYLIASKICEAVGVNDFSTLSLQCLIDKLGVTLPTERTLINLLQLAFDNECLLKDLIDDLEDRIIDPNLPLDLDMKCLEVLDGFGNPIPVTQMTLNQLLITEFCLLKLRVAALEAKDIDLQAQIDELRLLIVPYVLPTVTTCLAGTRNLAQQIIVGFQEICDYHDAVGTIADIQLANSEIYIDCPNVNTEYALKPDWVINPTSLAQTNINQSIMICDLLSRIAVLEDCACQVTCKDISIGFLTRFNDNQTVTLQFTTGAGTAIPAGFEDCGSSIKITNQDGLSFTTAVVITQDGDSADIDVSMFENGDTLTFDLGAILCNETLTCHKCVSKTVKYLNGCCVLTATGDVTLIYKMCIANS